MLFLLLQAWHQSDDRDRREQTSGVVTEVTGHAQEEWAPCKVPAVTATLLSRALGGNRPILQVGEWVQTSE